MAKPNNIRISFIFLLFLTLYGALLANLYIIQIKQTKFFKNLAQQQYHTTITLKPPRAEIYDRTGKQLLAMNQDSLSAFITPSSIENREAVEKFLEDNFPAAYTRLKQGKNHHFMYVKRKLTPEQIKLIEDAGLKDIKIVKEPSRFYPINAAGHVVGYTNIDNIGISGIENLYDKQLAGEPESFSLSKDARSGNFYFDKTQKSKGSKQQKVVLTIDGTLQFLVQEELRDAVSKFGAKEGAVLILDPSTGDIIAMANYPEFDPNNIEENLDPESIKNRIITNAYELGSVIKIFLALAAFEESVVTPDEEIDCENKKVTKIDGIKFSTWKEHGKVTFAEVIQGSNNIGVAKVALRMGDKLYDHYKKLKFGKKIGIFPGENKGFINPPDKWSRASIISLSFGYEMSANLLQLAQALSIVANDGYLIKPRLVKNNQEQIIKEKIYNPENIAKIKLILENTVLENYDKIAKNAILKNYKVMGKTGTARLLTNGKYDKNRHIFTFAGIVQKGNYKRIIITFIKETTQKNPYASTIAVPLFEEVVNKMLIHDKIV